MSILTQAPSLPLSVHIGSLPLELLHPGFYWSAYTVITVGYGSITIASNAERIVAMLSMTTGAIICNAGIAAVFGSIIRLVSPFDSIDSLPSLHCIWLHLPSALALLPLLPL